MLKAKPKGAGGWENYSQCTIGISIGNPNCQGENLQAIVDWLNTKLNFQLCMIDLSDTLNRYNIMLEEGVDEETARTRAQQEGTQWLKDNQHILDRINIPYTVTRWEKWLSDPKIAEYKARFHKAFETNKEFRDAVFADVERYHTRHERSAWDLNNIGRMKYSIGYLIEELAVHSAIYDNGPVASLYPGEQQESFRMVRSGAIDNVPEGMRNSHFVRLNIYNTDAHKNPANDIKPKDDDQGPNGAGMSDKGKKTPTATGSFHAAGTPHGTTSPRPSTKPSRNGINANGTKAASLQALPSYLQLLGISPNGLRCA